MPGGVPRAQPPPEHGGEPLPRVLLWRLRRNPLRRATDVLQGWIAVGLFVAVLLGMPAAMFLAGDTAYRHYARQAEHERETRQRTAAVLVRDAPRHPEPGSAEEKKTRYPVEVRLTGPDGRPRTVRTDVEPGLTRGSTVTVWADPEGRLTGPPLSTDQIRSRSMGWAILAALGAAGLGAAAYGAACLVIARRNLAAWDAAWAGTAPRWTTSG
ncbi:hypothetical protein [Streptomyces sp. NPDC004065]|uniref:Rv1733c family protein n=1 Tax=Streptomyces sp. NPDC004065 TaxID=3364689 RepID=UPI00384CE98F